MRWWMVLALAVLGCAADDGTQDEVRAAVVALEAGTDDAGAEDAGAPDVSTDGGEADAGATEVCACVAEDDGVPETLASGIRWYGDTGAHADPVLLGRWEDPQHGVYKVGEGQPGYHALTGVRYRALQVLAFDADDKLSFMTDGRQRMKLQDHPVGLLLHLSEVPNLWFGNTNREPVTFHYQGASLGGDARGELMSIKGQSCNGTPQATSVTGGDLLVTAGDASASPLAGAVPLDPGELLLSGGKVGNATRGNVAFHDMPADWAGMEGGLYVHDVATPPAWSPSAGGYLYAEGGALYWVGSAGTVTMIAAP